MQISEVIEKLESQQHLSRAEAGTVMERLLSGSVPDEEIVSFLAALRDKGEQVEELVGFAQVMRAHAAEGLRQAGVDLEALLAGSPLLDTCGTGGDGHATFNVSTAVALVAAAGGVRVAKHGNRSISSRCGSADVLEALGVSLNLPFARIPACLEEVGMVFLFAPSLHAAMKHVMNARRALKTKSVFNLLGPLTNPLRASVQLVGVYDASRTEMMARALGAVGTERAFVVTGSDGMDENTLSLHDATLLFQCRRGPDPPRDPGRFRFCADATRGTARRRRRDQRRAYTIRPSRQGRSPPGCGPRQRCRGICGGDQGGRLYPRRCHGCRSD